MKFVGIFFPKNIYNSLFSRCYFCGQKFLLPQELSRHIRDKICKANDKCPREDANVRSKSLSTISLLELPIITDISHDDEVTKLIDASEQFKRGDSTTSLNVDALVQDNYMIIEHGTELNLSQAGPTHDHEEGTTSGEVDHPVLWGCKQCDFRFVYAINVSFYNI